MIDLKIGILSEQLCERSIFLVCLFKYYSSVLEPNGMATKYPIVFNDLYNGKIDKSKAVDAGKELEEIRESLKNIKVTISEVKSNSIFKTKEFIEEVDDFDFYINKDAINLYEMFKTSGMRGNFIDTLHYSTIRSQKFDSDVEVVYSQI